MAKLLILVFGIGYFFVIGDFQKLNTPIKDLGTICKSKKKSCSECIQTSGCKWCKDEIFDKGPRCIFDNPNVETSCRQFENPTSFLPEVGGVIHTKSAVRPSHVHINLRPGSHHKLNITMSYKDEENRPLDLYILMDLSCTMEKHKDSIARLAERLAKRLERLTKGLRMGFGSFVDKPIQPFAMAKEEGNTTCNGKTIEYLKPHVFKNHLPLTKDIANFTKTVNESIIMTNIDVPEGSLDALMQAVVCKKGLNWSSENNTRKVIVLSTDGPFHIGGDGKLGGIIRPNDGKCHLNQKGEYDKATELDYPSIYQIRDKIQENNIFVIFVVTNQYKNLYTKLAEKIGSDLSSVSVINENNSSSIINVIEEEYKKVVQTVNFQAIVHPVVNAKYYAKCPGSSEYRDQSGCDNLTPNATVDYKVELSLKRCPSNGTLWTTEVALRPSTSNAKEDFLNVTIDMICACSCENITPTPSSSAKCTNRGFEQCGICKCDEGAGGPVCNCNKSGEVVFVDQESCLYDGSLCHNRGHCECGKCNCEKGSVGTHCECKESDCPNESEDNGVCNGNLGQGTCGCNKGCSCTTGFYGVRCECPISEELCTNSGKVCSGSNAGICDCGKCSCNSGHHGKYCELKVEFDAYTSSCKSSLRELVGPCVKCLSFDNVAVSASTRLSSCKTQCGSESRGMIVATLHEKIDQRRSTECEGKLVDEKECEVQYIVSGQNVYTNETYVRAEQSSTCPPSSDIVPIILSVVGIMFIIGIGTLLLWKLLTHIHDKNEFNRFENDRANPAWIANQNPLYKGTVSEFKNPAYGIE